MNLPIELAIFRHFEQAWYVSAMSHLLDDSECMHPFNLIINSSYSIRKGVAEEEISKERSWH